MKIYLNRKKYKKKKENNLVIKVNNNKRLKISFLNKNKKKKEKKYINFQKKLCEYLLSSKIMFSSLIIKLRKEYSCVHVNFIFFLMTVYFLFESLVKCFKRISFEFTKKFYLISFSLFIWKQNWSPKTTI